MSNKTSALNQLSVDELSKDKLKALTEYLNHLLEEIEDAEDAASDPVLKKLPGLRELIDIVPTEQCKQVVVSMHNWTMELLFAPQIKGVKLSIDNGLPRGEFRVYLEDGNRLEWIGAYSINPHILVEILKR